MIRVNKADLIFQMVSNNEIRDSLILEKITVQKKYESKQLVKKIKPDLEVYLHDDNELSELTETDGDVILCQSLKRRRLKHIEE